MTTSQDNEYVTLAVDERGVAWLTLNRPEKHNAFDDLMIAMLRRYIEELHSDKQARVVVLQSRGKSFSAGADLSWMQRMTDYSYDENYRDARALAEMLHRLHTLPQPTLARVQGNAFGGALGLISCCDIAIASRASRFGLTECRIGLIPATIAPYVTQAIGARWSRRLFQSAERFGPELAERIFLIHERCEPEDLDSRVQAMVDELLRNSPAAMRQAKLLVQDFADAPIDDAVIDDTSARIAKIRVSKEGQEGLQAFLQKRSPAWMAEGEH